MIWPGVLVLLGVFLIGLGSGVFLRRSGVRAARAEAERLGGELGTTRTQLAHTEESLLRAQRELEAQRSAVTKHFARTSELFGDLTRQYTALYAHLAEGARELCPGQRIPLGAGFAEPLLEAGPSPEPGSDEPATREQAEAQLAAVRRAAEQIAAAPARAAARTGA
jgi:uncharacterized membrane-anchored protein YhcB (DUF1043 family)